MTDGLPIVGFILFFDYVQSNSFTLGNPNKDSNIIHLVTRKVPKRRTNPFHRFIQEFDRSTFDENDFLQSLQRAFRNQRSEEELWTNLMKLSDYPIQEDSGAHLIPDAIQEIKGMALF